jgi:hypothetical protein
MVSFDILSLGTATEVMQWNSFPGAKGSERFRDLLWYNDTPKFYDGATWLSNYGFGGTPLPRLSTNALWTIGGLHSI